MKKTALLLALGSLAFAVATGEASASEDYPDAMKSDLALGYAPGCDLCHAEAKMPVGDADTPFAASLVKRGLVGDDVASLAAALKKDRGVDSDGDGAEDLDELSWGGNPNAADAPVGTAPPEVQYGCGGGPSGHRTASLGGALVALGLVASRRRRKK